MRRMYEYDLYFPKVNDRGICAADEIFEQLKKRLTDFFGGLTDFHHRSEGAWQYGGVTYHDDVILLRMLGENRESSRTFLQRIKHELAATLQEKDILVIEREVYSFSA